MSRVGVVMPAAWHFVKLSLHMVCSKVSLTRSLEHGAAGMPHSSDFPAST